MQPWNALAGRLPRLPLNLETTRSSGRRKYGQATSALPIGPAPARQRFTAASNAERSSLCAAVWHTVQATAKLARHRSSSSSATSLSRSTGREENVRLSTAAAICGPVLTSLQNVRRRYGVVPLLLDWSAGAVTGFQATAEGGGISEALPACRHRNVPEGEAPDNYRPALHAGGRSRHCRGAHMTRAGQLYDATMHTCLTSPLSVCVCWREGSDRYSYFPTVGRGSVSFTCVQTSCRGGGVGVPLPGCLLLLLLLLLLPAACCCRRRRRCVAMAQPAFWLKAGEQAHFAISIPVLHRGSLVLVLERLSPAGQPLLLLKHKVAPRIGAWERRRASALTVEADAWDHEAFHHGDTQALARTGRALCNAPLQRTLQCTLSAPASACAHAM